MNPMRNILNKFLITYVSICFLSSPGVSAEEAGMVLPVKSKKTEINWKSWSTDYEPLQITADHDDAIVIFRFEQPPKDPQVMRLTSNAAVYVETDSGLVPVSKRAKEEPNPNIKLKAKD